MRKRGAKQGRSSARLERTHRGLLHLLLEPRLLLVRRGRGLAVLLLRWRLAVLAILLRRRAAVLLLLWRATIPTKRRLRLAVGLAAVGLAAVLAVLHAGPAEVAAAVAIGPSKALRRAAIPARSWRRRTTVTLELLSATAAATRREGHGVGRHAAELLPAVVGLHFAARVLLRKRSQGNCQGFA